MLDKMKLGKILPVVLSLGLLLPFGAQAHATDEPAVRVELTSPFALSAAEVLSTVPFTVNGNYMVEGQPTLMLLGGQKYFVQLENGTLSLYQFGPVGLPVPLVQGVNTLKIIPSLPDGEAATLKVEGKKNAYSYRGAMEFQIGEKGALKRIVPINVVGMESYLKGVVPSEMYASWNREALKAQAVAARTYAVRHMNAKPGSAYINDTVQYQAYEGMKNEKENSNLAVEETRGEVLSHNGSLIEALYSASNGGYTEAPENVWKSSKGSPYLVAKPDPYDAKSDSPNKSWQQTLTITQLQDKIKNRTPAVGTIKKVEVKETYPSGRIADIVLEGDKGTLHLSKEEARTAFGLKSALYSVKANYGTAVPSPAPADGQLSVYNGATTAHKGSDGLVVTNGVTQATVPSNLVIQGATQTKVPEQNGGAGTQSSPVSITFTGSGYGHGVGMSQWGAQQMAKEGKTYRDILNFYYAPAQVSGGYGAGN